LPFPFSSFKILEVQNATIYFCIILDVQNTIIYFLITISTLGLSHLSFLIFCCKGVCLSSYRGRHHIFLWLWKKYLWRKGGYRCHHTTIFSSHCIPHIKATQTNHSAHIPRTRNNGSPWKYANYTRVGNI